MNTEERKKLLKEIGYVLIIFSHFLDYFCFPNIHCL